MTEQKQGAKNVAARRSSPWQNCSTGKPLALRKTNKHNFLKMSSNMKMPLKYGISLKVFLNIV